MDLAESLFVLFLGVVIGCLLGQYSSFFSGWGKERCELRLNREELFSDAFVNAILILEPVEGRILYADERAVELYQPASGHLEGMAYSSFSENDSDTLLIPGEHLRETHVNGLNEKLHLEVSCAKVRFRNQESILVALRTVDGTSRKEEGAEIKKAAIDATYNGVGILNMKKDGCPLVDANPALIKALEMPYEEVIGAPFFDLLPDREDRQNIYNRIREGKGWKGELTVDDGREERWFFMSLDPLEEQEGFIAVVCQDITEKRMAETRLVDAIVQTQQQERKRIATDLHDGVGQTLTAANAYLRTIEKKWNKQDKEGAMKHLPMVSDLLRKGIEEIRNISHDLMPNTLKEYGLIRAIRQMVQEMDEGSEGTRIRFHTAMNPEKPLGEALEGAMYRICQELVNNSLCHAEASEIEVTLKGSSQETILEIMDNGKGFDPSALGEEGSGIKGIKERARALKGSVEMDGQPGKGAFFRVRLPLNNEEQPWETSIPSA
ncbi:MAG: histidine kinase [Flavobacteriales bacterium]